MSDPKLIDISSGLEYRARTIPIRHRRNSIVAAAYRLYAVAARAAAD